ncbi:hypothetical protein [Herbidospora daliensis]|uniref:hypothetical protein n=1 Tax=Herbidospora daliensis TaxID=295585 RepID=UPI0007802373|nr:hypothetical protein [Herbidospora daliensis]
MGATGPAGPAGAILPTVYASQAQTFTLASLFDPQTLTFATACPPNTTLTGGSAYIWDTVAGGISPFGSSAGYAVGNSWFGTGQSTVPTHQLIVQAVCLPLN